MKQDSTKEAIEAPLCLYNVSFSCWATLCDITRFTQQHEIIGLKSTLLTLCLMPFLLCVADLSTDRMSKWLDYLAEQNTAISFLHPGDSIEMKLIQVIPSYLSSFWWKWLNSSDYKISDLYCGDFKHEKINNKKAGLVCWHSRFTHSTVTHIWQAAELESPTQTLVCPGFDSQTKTIMEETLSFVHSALYPRVPRGTTLEHSFFSIVSEGKHWGNML